MERTTKEKEKVVRDGTASYQGVMLGMESMQVRLNVQLVHDGSLLKRIGPLTAISISHAI